MASIGAMGSIGDSLLNKKGEVLSASTIEELKTSVGCEVVVKGEAEEDVYRKAISRFNHAFVKEAAFVVFVENEAQIAAALKFVQKWDVDLAVTCGRHSFYGASSTNGLVIDLWKMRKVSVDKEGMTITAQGGCRAVDLETPLQAEGLSVVMGAMNDTGIGGITLGGGTGFLTGQYGMVIDNLLKARMVLADGSTVEVSEQVNPDLFLALRGAGANFGVVTEFTYRVHKQGDVFAGPMVFTPDKLEDFINLIDDLKARVDNALGKLAIFVLFNRVPPSTAIQPLVLMFYDGSEQDARKHAAPLFELGPAHVMAQMMPFADLTKPSPQLLGPPTHQNYSATNMQLFSPIDKDVLKLLINNFDAYLEKYGPAVAPSRLAFELRSYHKTASIPASATATSTRQHAIALIIELQHDDSLSPELAREEAKAIIEPARKVMRERYPDKVVQYNANLGSGMEKAEEMFGENLPKLRALKKKYDPSFIFNKWYPIKPAE